MSATIYKWIVVYDDGRTEEKMGSRSVGFCGRFDRSACCDYPKRVGRSVTVMPNKEKVIKGLNYCTHTDGAECPNCPYWQDDDCVEALNADVLVLLKEQEWNVLTEDADGVIHGLPGDDGQYLMTDGKDIWIDEYVDGVDDGIILDSGRDIREIAAWMYMPALPKHERK